MARATRWHDLASHNTMVHTQNKTSVDAWPPSLACQEAQKDARQPSLTTKKIKQNHLKILAPGESDGPRSSELSTPPKIAIWRISIWFDRAELRACAWGTTRSLSSAWPCFFFFFSSYLLLIRHSNHCQNRKIDTHSIAM